MQDLLAEYRTIRHPRNVGLISLSHGVNEFYSIVFPPIVPLLVADLGISYARAGLLLTVFFLMYSFFQLPAGLVADRIGKKRLLVLGLVGMAGSLGLASAAPTYEALVVAQALAGVAGSTYHPAGMSLVSDIESGATEGKAMGVFGFGGMAGVAAAPVTVGGVAALVDWRSALLVAAVGGLAVVAAFQVLFTEPESASEVGGGDATATDGASDPSAGPVARARGRLSALLRFRITPSVVVLTVLTLCVSLQLRALHAFATGFLVDGVGQSASRANGLFFLMLAASAVASIWVGGLADRVDRRLLGTAAAGVTTLVLAAMVLLPGVDGATGPGVTALLAGAFAVLGFAVYGCTPVKNALVSEHATEGASGSLFGVMQTTSAVGSAAGPALFGLVATEAGVDVAFPAVAAVGVLVVGCFLALGRVE